MTTARPIGALRHRLALERSALADDGSTVWTPVATLFAAITSLSGGEVATGGGEGGRVTHRLELRFRDDLSSRDRLVTGTRVFRVLAVRDLDERRARLLVDAEEEGR